MAARNAYSNNRTEYAGYDRYGNPVRRNSAEYQQGSTVRKIRERKRQAHGYDYYQERRYREEYERKERERRMKRRQYLLRQRENALTFRNLAVITLGSITVVIMCIFYLNLMSTISHQSKQLNSMQRELVVLQEENNSRYNHLNNSMSLEEVRVRAVESLGMVNATSEHIITYRDPSADYVTQNEEIPR